MGYPFFLCALFFRIEHDTEIDHDELKKECQLVRLIPLFLSDLLTCLGNDRIAARVKIQMFIPHVANTAVVKCLIFHQLAFN